MNDKLTITVCSKGDWLCQWIPDS